jgi:hypothetical protein
LPSTPKNKIQKVGMFSDGQSTVVFSHVFTTNPPRFTTQKPRSARQNLQNPQQNRPFRLLRKKQKKKTPKPFCGPGVIGLQTARKPNSVLDDHSSTRRITAAL